MKETNLEKDKRWLEVHFTSGRMKAWEAELHSGTVLVMAVSMKKCILQLGF